MITKIETLKDLPYKDFHAYILKTEDDTKFIGDNGGYIFISKSPKCIYLFVEISENPEIV